LPISSIQIGYITASIDEMTIRHLTSGDQNIKIRRELKRLPYKFYAIKHQKIYKQIPKMITLSHSAASSEWKTNTRSADPSSSPPNSQPAAKTCSTRACSCLSCSRCSTSNTVCLSALCATSGISSILSIAWIRLWTFLALTWTTDDCARPVSSIRRGRTPPGSPARGFSRSLSSAASNPSSKPSSGLSLDSWP